MRRDRRSEDCVLELSRSHPAGVTDVGSNDKCKSATQSLGGIFFRLVILSEAKDLSPILGLRPSRNRDTSGCAPAEHRQD